MFKLSLEEVECHVLEATQAPTLLFQRWIHTYGRQFYWGNMLHRVLYPQVMMMDVNVNVNNNKKCTHI